MSEIIDRIKRVIGLEIKTLEQVSNNVDDNYEKVVNLIFGSKGKVVIVGVGKSGIIARKIVATMVSTGTPAVFLHPTEAIHGDIGIVSRDDIVLAISKSGTSIEVVDILDAVKTIGATVIALTANKDSEIAGKADYILYMPIEEEACPLNLAPTCSTTATLAIGDALAVALMELRDFKEEDFALFHPAGELGKKLLLKVGDVMRQGKRNPVININESVEHMLFEISNKLTGALSVINQDGYLQGIVTDYDIRKILMDKKDIYSLTIKDIMNTNPNYIHNNQKAYDALELMENREKPISVLTVLEEGSDKVIGMIHLHDIIH